MSQTYFAILTAIGEAKLANATALGTTLQLTQMGIGDGNGSTPLPNRSQTALVRENRRAPLNRLFVDPANASQIIAEQVIPEEIGGWWIREIGLYDTDGNLCAVANCPDTYKPVLAEGSGRTQVIRMVLIVSNTAAVQLKIDPAIVLATRGYVDDEFSKHLAALDPHPVYLTSAEGDAKIAAALVSPVLSGNPTAPTAPQFDNDTSIATTAFVQRALGNLSGQVTYSAAKTLTAADAGKSITLTGTGYTVTIPLSSQVEAGCLLWFLNHGTGNITISRQGSDVIQAGNTSVTSFTLGAGDTLVLAAGQAGSWTVRGGSAHLSHSPLFGVAKNASGYQKLPGGLILQWGQGLFDAQPGNVKTPSLPIAYPTAHLFAVATNASSTGAGGVPTPPSVGALALNLNQVQIQQHSNVAHGTYFHCLSIGY